MNLNLIDLQQFLWLAMAVAGLWTIYLGYRLFCDVPIRFASRRMSLVANLASGALLAVFGAGIVMTGVRGMVPAQHRAAKVRYGHDHPTRTVIPARAAADRTV